MVSAASRATEVSRQVVSAGITRSMNLQATGDAARTNTQISSSTSQHAQLHLLTGDGCPTLRPPLLTVMPSKLHCHLCSAANPCSHMPGEDCPAVAPSAAPPPSLWPTICHCKRCHCHGKLHTVAAAGPLAAAAARSQCPQPPQHASLGVLQCP